MIIKCIGKYVVYKEGIRHYQQSEIFKKTRATLNTSVVVLPY